MLNEIGSAYQHAGELLNFGAFLAFMGVNFACFWQFSISRQPGYQRRLLQDAILPLIGFLFCGLIWFNSEYHRQNGGRYLVRRRHSLRRLQDQLVPVRSGHDRFQRLVDDGIKARLGFDWRNNFVASFPKLSGTWR